MANTIETRNEAFRLLDGLLDKTVKRAYNDENGLGQVITIGDLGERRRLVVGVFGYERRWRVGGERCLTGEQTVQPTAALVEDNGVRAVWPLSYAEDIVGLPITLPARVIGCLISFNADGKQ